MHAGTCVSDGGGRDGGGGGRGKHSCEKYGLELDIEQVYLDGSLK